MFKKEKKRKDSGISTEENSVENGGGKNIKDLQNARREIGCRAVGLLTLEMIQLVVEVQR